MTFQTGSKTVLDLHKVETNSRALFKASGSLARSLPPPRALSALPPPLPPTRGAMAWMILPAWNLAVKSGETVATRETAPLEEPPRTTTPLNWLFRASATAWRKSPPTSPRFSMMAGVDWVDVVDVVDDVDLRRERAVSAACFCREALSCFSRSFCWVRTDSIRSEEHKSEPQSP